MKRINALITGSKGQLGKELQLLSPDYTDFTFYYCDIDMLDITDYNAMNQYIIDNNINAIINCAAYTNVDKAESDKENAQNTNTKAVENMALLSRNLNLHLIHISTDYVFDGTSNQPWIESDIKNPISVYGKTKSEGEDAILKLSKKAIIIRTSWLYSSYGNNFVKSMIKYGNDKNSLNVVFDQIGTPTYARDLASTILLILKKQISSDNYNEIYHFSNEGVTSWYDFAVVVINYMKINCDVYPIESKNYPTPATRPFYSVLNKEKISNAFDLKINHWQKSLYECLEEIKKSKY